MFSKKQDTIIDWRDKHPNEYKTGEDSELPLQRKNTLAKQLKRGFVLAHRSRMTSSCQELVTPHFQPGSREWMNTTADPSHRPGSQPEDYAAHSGWSSHLSSIKILPPPPHMLRGLAPEQFQIVSSWQPKPPQGAHSETRGEVSQVVSDRGTRRELTPRRPPHTRSWKRCAWKTSPSTGSSAGSRLEL